MSVLGVNDFKARLLGGGARANLFKATINFPGYAGGDVDMTSFMCKGAALPASTINPIVVPFRGRQLKVAGDRQFGPWTVTIINDVTSSVRGAFERWMNGINTHELNTGLSAPIAYQADLKIEQLDRSGLTTKTYDLRGAFPTEISEIAVSYDSENTIEEFTVTFEYQYWESDTTI